MLPLDRYFNLLEVLILPWGVTFNHYFQCICIMDACAVYLHNWTCPPHASHLCLLVGGSLQGVFLPDQVHQGVSPSLVILSTGIAVFNRDPSPPHILCLTPSQPHVLCLLSSLFTPAAPPPLRACRTEGLSLFALLLLSAWPHKAPHAGSKAEMPAKVCL